MKWAAQACVRFVRTVAPGTTLLGLALLIGVGCGGEQGEEQRDIAAEIEARRRAASAELAGRAPAEAAKDAVAENQPPQAKFEALPLEAYANMTPISFDATLTNDDFDLSTEMRKRWDFDGDGQWDTGFMRANHAQWTYRESGDYQPRLLVRDSGGLIDTTRGPVIAVRLPCPAPDVEMTDINIRSPHMNETFKLSDYEGAPLLVWFAAPSK